MNTQPSFVSSAKISTTKSSAFHPPTHPKQTCPSTQPQTQRFTLSLAPSRSQLPPTPMMALPPPTHVMVLRTFIPSGLNPLLHDLRSLLQGQNVDTYLRPLFRSPSLSRYPRPYVNGSRRLQTVRRLRRLSSDSSMPKPGERRSSLLRFSRTLHI